MCAYVRVYISHIRILVWRAHVYVYGCVHMGVCLHVHVHMGVCVHMPVFIYARTRACHDA